MSRNTILIMAGGTGGHVYPALAVADYLKQIDTDIIWLGTNKGIEADLVPKNGYPLFYVEVSGIRGKNLLTKIFSPFFILKAIVQSIKVIRQHKPSVVLGMGGFASGPGGIAAFLMGVPLCIHEQNSIAGLTNKILKPFATLAFEAFPNSFEKSKKVVTTGNPVRNSILTINKESSGANSKDKINVLVVGGSLGARTLNHTVPKAFNNISDNAKFNIRHQSGNKHFSDATLAYKDTNLTVSVEPYIDDITQAYAWADLVICRSGAMTIAELSIVGIASILIPYPYAVDDHQTMNARYLSDHGYAILIQESDLTESVLANAIVKLTESREYLISIADSVRKLGKPNATKDVAEKCLELAHA